ncbi:hypothetical protein AB0I89_32105 [Micromonospora sp. NPDC049801]|uniref:hypothetical protein n=1 Tax=unclassified Micromonospora TaxID=2617518 RepID=UPI0033D4320C
MKTTHATASAARARLGQALADLRQIRTTLTTAIQDAHRSVADDQGLSEQGKTTRVHTLTAEARRDAERQVDALMSRVDDDADTVRAYVAEHRPQPQPGMEAIMARQTAWRRTEALLAAGRTPRAVIASTGDVEALLAMREEFPTWIQTQSPTPGGMDALTFEEPDATQIIRAVDERLAELTSGDQRAAIIFDRELAVTLAELPPMVEHTRLTAAGAPQSGSMGLDAAIASRFAGQHA